MSANEPDRDRIQLFAGCYGKDDVVPSLEDFQYDVSYTIIR